MKIHMLPSLSESTGALHAVRKQLDETKEKGGETPSHKFAVKQIDEELFQAKSECAGEHGEVARRFLRAV